MREWGVALVTGANKGIGYDIAAGLGALGWKVGIGARNDARREAAVEKLRADGVSGGSSQEPTGVDPDVIRTAVETNVIGVVQVTNAMLPLLRRSASPRIVNVSSGIGSLTRQADSIGGRSAGFFSAAYAPSKTMLNAVTVQYAKELRDENILINLCCPGWVATDMNGFRGMRTPEQGAAIAIELATLPDDGPSGGYFADDGPIPW